MHYKQLDGLRFFAVLAVLFHHICDFNIFNYFPLGSFGVTLFFVVSGFLITEILLKEKENNVKTRKILKIFFIKRILRIFPLYFIYIFICYVLVPKQTLEMIAWLLTYTTNIWVIMHNQLPFWYFAHLWSLCVEEQFYLIWPFLIIFIPNGRLKTVFYAMIIFAIANRAFNVFYINGYDLFNYNSLFTTLDCFGAGAVLAYLKTFKSKYLSTILTHRYIPILAIVLFILNIKYGTPLTQQALSRAFYTITSVYLVGIAVTSKFTKIGKTLLENNTIVYLGKISYGIYIYHLICWGIFGKYFNDLLAYFNFSSYINNSFLKIIMEFIVITLCTILVSAISYELIEKRFLNLKKRFNYST
jgi:peptidoglycan/LPS O-acetylase OafA/YrhL